MTVRDQENVFLFEFGLIVPMVPKYLLLHNLCRRRLPTWRKVIPVYSFLLQSKIFLMYIMCRTSWPNVEYLKTSEILNVSSHFDTCSFVQISRNLGFLQVEECAFFSEICHLHLRNFSIVGL